VERADRPDPLPVGDDALEIWGRLMPLFHASRAAFFGVMGELSLTPPHGRAVMTLSAGPVKMRDLAEQMVCDASYVTNVVDRLEQLGLARRQESPGDRRVREIVLTGAGYLAAARIKEAMARPPAALAKLSAGDLAALLRILRKLGPVDRAPQWSHPSVAR
jgi:DNA-binding MarR family transcriptional regulator